VQANAWLESGWTTTQDPKDRPRLDEVQLKVWLGCGWLGARDPAGSAMAGTVCRQAVELIPTSFGAAPKVPMESSKGTAAGKGLVGGEVGR
jgi:hypothetical protein